MCYNKIMKKLKDFKSCPRCNAKVPQNFKKCGGCGLNFEKLKMATNKEARRAIKLQEKERVVYTKDVPPDVNKWKFFLLNILLGWFGVASYRVGKFWRGFFQSFSFLCCVIYLTYVYLNVEHIVFYNVATIAGMVWVIGVFMCLSDAVRIAINKYKYPVSLPYKD